MAYVTDLDGIIHRVSRNGLVATYHGRCPNGLPHYSPPIDVLAAFKVKNWADNGSKIASRIMQEIIAAGWRYETRYAGKPAIYGLVIWPLTMIPDHAPRRVAMAHFDGIDNLKQFHLDAGCTQRELDNMCQVMAL